MLDSIHFYYSLISLWIKSKVSKLNEHAFNLALLAGAVAYMAHAYTGENEAYKVISLIILKVALFINISDLYIKFLGSVGRDINSEVFDQNNNATAIYISGFRIALAIVLLTAI